MKWLIFAEYALAVYEVTPLLKNSKSIVFITIQPGRIPRGIILLLTASTSGPLSGRLRCLLRLEMSLITTRLSSLDLLQKPPHSQQYYSLPYH